MEARERGARFHALLKQFLTRLEGNIARARLGVCCKGGKQPR